MGLTMRINYLPNLPHNEFTDGQFTTRWIYLAMNISRWIYRTVDFQRNEFTDDEFTDDEFNDEEFCTPWI